MTKLDKAYSDQLKSIADAIATSEELQRFLDAEEEEDYTALVEAHEPTMLSLYEEVAENSPLQLLSLETAMLDSDFEGLFMPRVLGYSILRGTINADYKYKRPQDHLSQVMAAICSSVNFDFVKDRIGQAIQVCFAVSSDIWVTSFIEGQTSRTLKNFLKAKRLVKYRHLEERKRAYDNFKAQFRGLNFYTTAVPDIEGDLFLRYDQMSTFLHYRIANKLSHISYEDAIVGFLGQKDWSAHNEYLYILALSISFVDLGKENANKVSQVLTELRKEGSSFSKRYFVALEEIYEKGDLYFDFSTDRRVSSLLDQSVEDDLAKYYATTTEVATKGFVHEDSIEIVRANYYAHEGLSKFNECLRYSVLGHFVQEIRSLVPENYLDYFELNKTLVLYINIFDNQQFNQSIKGALLDFIRKFLKVYTDKRGKDYQELKKFVTTTFLDLKFMTEKEIKELFTKKRVKPLKS